MPDRIPLPLPPLPQQPVMVLVPEEVTQQALKLLMLRPGMAEEYARLGGRA